jgi:KUP system potassium uptake protein
MSPDARTRRVGRRDTAERGRDGEGGILALMALLGVKRQTRPAIVALGLFGAALIYGDGAITPAISVLSALEGLTIAAPGLGPYVVPMAVTILVVLFAIQSQGTARIGHAFGPVMAAWFVTIALLGVWGITKHPAVLLGLDPRYAISYLAHDGFKGFAVLGGVFLCVTGAEALYADMGHFGATPIRVAWSAIVFPSLVLNCAGQAAIVLADGVTADNIFYRLCPAPLLVPMIVLATVATVIASQSIITGAFSMTRQAIQLGWFPRLNITQTSAEGYGQIYVGPVNWLLMVVTRRLRHLGFGDDADDLSPATDRHARNLAMEPPRQRQRRRDIPRHRYSLLRLQHFEDSGRRLCSTRARRHRVPDHVDLASRRCRRHRAHPREPHPDRHLHGEAGA